MKDALSTDVVYPKSVLSSGFKTWNIDIQLSWYYEKSSLIKMNDVAGILSSFGSMVANAVSQANAQMVFDASSLIEYKNTSVSVVQSLSGIWSDVKQTLPSAISPTHLQWLEIGIAE